MLRLRPGEEVIAADGHGRWSRTTWRGEAALETLRGGTGVGGDGASAVEARTEPALTVAFAPVKGERPEWVVQKLTELGIDRIVRCSASAASSAGAGHAARRRWSGCAGWRARRRRSAGGSGCPTSATPCASPTCTQLGAPGEVVLAQLSGDRPDPGAARGGGGAGGRVEHRASSRSGLPTVGFGLSVLRAETAAVTAGALLASLRTGTVAAADGSGAEGPPE